MFGGDFSRPGQMVASRSRRCAYSSSVRANRMLFSRVRMPGSIWSAMARPDEGDLEQDAAPVVGAGDAADPAAVPSPGHNP